MIPVIFFKFNDTARCADYITINRMPDHLNLCKKRNKTYTIYKTYFSVNKIRCFF
jgi:hypothetical protein